MGARAGPGPTAPRLRGLRGTAAACPVEAAAGRGPERAGLQLLTGASFALILYFWSVKSEHLIKGTDFEKKQICFRSKLMRFHLGRAD